MAIDTASIIEGVVTGLSVHTLTNNNAETIQDTLNELHITLKQLSIYLTENMHTKDIYKIVTLYKANQGPTFTPYTEGRKFIDALVGAPTTLNVYSPIGQFNLILAPAGVWQHLDMPDGTQFALDAAYPQVTANIYVRYSDDESIA